MSDPRESTEPRKYINNLRPPIGTSFFNYQDIKVIEKGRLENGHGPIGQLPYGIVDWNVQAYTYATGAHPHDPDFAAKGGVVYTVILHDGTVSELVEWWEDLSFNIYADGMMPALHRPESGQQDGDEWSYEIIFQQTMAMLRNGGNEPTTFNAEFQETYTRSYVKQTGTWDNYGCSFQLIRTPANGDAGHTHKIRGLSVFRTSNLSQATVQFHLRVGYGVRLTVGSFTVPLVFSA